eukprot:gene2928-3195_t
MKPSRRQEDLTEPLRCSPRSLTDVNLNILSEDEHFCVIDKPPDVRMDGAFEVTVEKLMQHVLATGRPHVDVHQLKWIHQLDFATSGVLCVGLTREGAAAASSAFEHREVQKCYLAVVKGEVDLNMWPLATYEVQEEIVLPMKRRKVFQNSQRLLGSSSGSIDTWQQKIMLANLQRSLDALAKVNEEQLAAVSDVTLSQEVQRMRTLGCDALAKAPKQRKALRKLLRTLNIDVELIESKAPEESSVVSDEVVEKVVEEEVALTPEEVQEVVRGYQRQQQPHPAIFRRDDDPSTVVVRVPVAEVAGDFRCEPGHALRPGRSCETEVQVVEKGWYQGEKVTKLLLKPHTGRRHQLRIHCLVLGHPIVGDFTYNYFFHKNNSSTAKAAAERMMLHAYRLRIPFPLHGKCSTTFREALQKKATNSIAMVEAEAPDPFPFLDNILQPLLPAHSSLSKTS